MCPQQEPVDFVLHSVDGVHPTFQLSGGFCKLADEIVYLLSPCKDTFHKQATQTFAALY
jgi:hypothetical protein